MVSYGKAQSSALAATKEFFNHEGHEEYEESFLELFFTLRDLRALRGRSKLSGKKKV
jgi:hypothetical protein